MVAFGAFDRHNFGDLLFPHLLQSMLPALRVVPAGLAPRDLRTFGGHDVRPLREVLARPVRALVHAGGEVLTCSAWHAAAMLLPAERFDATVGLLTTDPDEQKAWARRIVGSDAQAPYVVSPREAGGAAVAFAGVGGVDLDHADATLRAEVLDKLRLASFVGVRDARTLEHLRCAGVAATLMPDPAVMLPPLLGDAVARRASRGDVARLRRLHPAGWLAVQCSAEFADDATLDALGHGLARVARRRELPIVLFRAGAAPWHDDLAVLERLATRLGSCSAEVFPSLHVRDIAALLAGCSACAASSLHAVIVASAFGRPAIGLRSPWLEGQPGKLDAYLRTWPVGAVERVSEAAAIGDALDAAMSMRSDDRLAAADDQARRYRSAFGSLARSLGLEAG